MGYDLILIAETQREAKQKMLAEQRKQHGNDGYAAKSWRHFTENTEVNLRQIVVGEVTWP